MGQLKTCCSFRDKDELSQLLDPVFNRKQQYKEHPITRDYEIFKVNASEDWEGGHDLGFCPSGEIFLARLKKQKTLPLENVVVRKIQGNGLGTEQNELKLFFEEYREISECDHKNLSRVKDFYFDNTSAYIVEEHLPNAMHINQFFEDRRRTTELHRAYIVRQILSGLNYLHNHNICHRDLTAESVVYQEKDIVQGKPLIKLVHYGVIKMLNHGNIMTEYVGTPHYMPPEIIHRSGFEPHCDIWSVGVITFLLLSGTLPFTGKTIKELQRKILEEEVKFEGELWNKISAKAKSFITLCLDKNCNARANANQLLSHPWIAQVTNNSDPTKSVDHFSSSFSYKLNMTRTRRIEQFERLIVAYMNVMSIQLSLLVQSRNNFQLLDDQQQGTLQYEEMVYALRQQYTDTEQKTFERLMTTQMHSFKTGNLQYGEFFDLGLKSLADRYYLLLRKSLTTLDVIDKHGNLNIEDIRTVLQLGGNKRTEEMWVEFLCDIGQNGEEFILFETFATKLQALLFKQHL